MEVHFDVVNAGETGVALADVFEDFFESAVAPGAGDGRASDARQVRRQRDGNAVLATFGLDLAEATSVARQVFGGHGGVGERPLGIVIDYENSARGNKGRLDLIGIIGPKGI